MGLDPACWPAHPCLAVSSHRGVRCGRYLGDSCEGGIHWQERERSRPCETGQGGRGGRGTLRNRFGAWPPAYAACTAVGRPARLARVWSARGVRQAGCPPTWQTLAAGSFGRETRSLKACYELMQAGYSNVSTEYRGLARFRWQDCAGTNSLASLWRAHMRCCPWWLTV